MPIYEGSIDIAIPCSSVYNQWTQFEDFPKFMEGVESVEQITDETLHWRANIAGVRREWDARITHQVPDEVIAWESTSGQKIAGAVKFEELDPMRTRVTLSMEYEPESLPDKTADVLGVIRRRVENDLENFKEFLEERGAETGEWRGKIEGGRRVRLDEPADRTISLDETAAEQSVYPTSRPSGPVPPVTPPPTR